MKELKTLRAEVNALKKTDSKTERPAAGEPRKRKFVPSVLELIENVSIVGSVEAVTTYNGGVWKTSEGL